MQSKQKSFLSIKYINHRQNAHFYKFCKKFITIKKPPLLKASYTFGEKGVI